MRRLVVTSLLVLTALGAAWIAPRPAPPAPDVRALHPVEGQAEPLIPELDAPLPVAIPEPPPVPDSFWDDCPTCGMG